MRFLVVLLAIMVSSAVRAETPLEPFNLRAVYHCVWGGLSVGELVIDSQETNQYRVKLDVETRGLVKFFSKHRSNSTVHGIAEPSYQPLSFVSNYSTKGKPKFTSLKFAPDGSLIEEVHKPQKPEKDETPVTDSLKKGVYDPVTSILAIRRKLHEARQSNQKQFTFRMYDGKRLSELRFRILGTTTIATGETKTPVIRVAASRKPLAGFSPKDLKHIEQGDPPLTIYFTQDEKLLPTRLELDTAFGRIVGFFRGYCPAQGTCKA